MRPMNSLVENDRTLHVQPHPLEGALLNDESHAAKDVGRLGEQLVLPVGDLVGVHVMPLRRCASSASVLSPRTAAGATLALNAAECVRRGLLLMAAPVLTGDVLAFRSSVHPHRTVQFCGASSLDRWTHRRQIVPPAVMGRVAPTRSRESIYAACSSFRSSDSPSSSCRHKLQRKQVPVAEIDAGSMRSATPFEDQQKPVT